MLPEKPKFLSKKNIAGFAIAFGLGVGVTVVAQKAFNPDYESPQNIVEASEDFLMLQQAVLNGLGPDSTINTPSSQYGKGFNIDGKQYTLLLDKEHKEAPNLKGYKRILIIKQREQREEYVMYDGSVVYKQVAPSIREPLDISELNNLAAAVKTDFKEWQKNMR